MTKEVNITEIAGNAPDHVKSSVGNTSLFYRRRPDVRGPIFGESITRRLAVTEISVDKNEEEPERLEGRVVCEITVEEDMINSGGGNMHGGCSAFLIDMCSSMALMALRMTNTGQVYGSVSQSLNVVYHSPADLGDKLRILNTTMTLGTRAQSARTEIWNVTHHRLVSSGVHVKMQPSPPKANL